MVIGDSIESDKKRDTDFTQKIDNAGDTVPRKISASTAIESSIETAPTKGSVTAKLAIRISECFFSSR